MNRTNRALNRIILIVVGVLFLTIGAAAVAVRAWPAGADYWTAGAAAATTWIDDAGAATRIDSSNVSWVAVAALALILIVVVLLIRVIVRLGGGRSGTVLSSGGSQNPLGRVVITEAFASDALKNSLSEREEILFSSVTAADIQRQPVMHVSVTPRQNTSPQHVVSEIDHLVKNLTLLTGRDIPTFISVHSGLRAKLAKDQRRLT